MTAPKVTVLRLSDDDRHGLLKILLLARHDGDPNADRLVDLVDAAYDAALGADFDEAYLTADRDSAIPVPANPPARHDRGGASLSTDTVNQLLTVSQAMDALQISRASIYRLFNSRELQWVQIGARRRITADEIDRFIAEHCSGAEARSS